MKQNLQNSGNGFNKLVNRWAAEKKKTFMALCLIGVMVFMWARVFGRKGPAGAGAAPVVQQAKKEQPNSQLNISFIELPKVAGRNDVLSKDFFAASDWRRFIGDGENRNLIGIEGVNVVSRNGSEEVMRRVAEKLKLQAIWLDKNPQAFINDKLLSIGDKLLVSDGVETYECEVAGIEENTVFIRCGESEIELKLMQAIEAAY